MDNILQVLNQSTPEEKIQGKTWYKSAHDFCIQLSKEFNIPIEKVIGVMCSLSPRREWGLNKRQTRLYLEGRRNLHTKLQMFKANMIWAGGDIETCLGGLKTINFFRNILNPQDKEPITIDMWMIRMYPDIVSLTPKKYETIKSEFKQVADEKGTIGNRIQSQAWLTMKRLAKN